MSKKTRIRNKKRFILFTFVLVISIFIISVGISDFGENLIYTNAQTIINKVFNNTNKDGTQPSNDKNSHLEEETSDIEKNQENYEKQGQEESFVADGETLNQENKEDIGNTIEEEKSVNEDSNKIENGEYLTLENDSNADDASVILPETMYKWNFYRDDNRKVAYLTFDDGPSRHSTRIILDILKDNSIKATFFTLGTSIENNDKAADLLKRMAREGHSIGNHGYSHNYSILYPNRIVDVEAFMKDIEKNNKILKDILGKNFKTRLIRMPGGHASWNGTAELDKALESKGIYQMDWNSLNGDAEGKDFPKEYLLDKLKETVGDKDVIIILMHDTDSKKGTVEYLQSAIDHLKKEGFEFRTLK